MQPRTGLPSSCVSTVAASALHYVEFPNAVLTLFSSLLRAAGGCLAKPLLLFFFTFLESGVFSQPLVVCIFAAVRLFLRGEMFCYDVVLLFSSCHCGRWGGYRAAMLPGREKRLSFSRRSIIWPSAC